MDEVEAESGDDVPVSLPREAWRLIDGVMDDAADAISNTPGGEWKLQSEREPLPDGVDKSRLVRLDRVIIGLWLMGARYGMRDQPRAISATTKVLLDLLKGFGGWSGRVVFVKKFGVRGLPGVGWLISLFQQVASIQDAHAIQNALERHIRGEAARIRKDLAGKPMKSKVGRARKTKVVYTRHESPKQRKANENWHSPRPR